MSLAFQSTLEFEAASAAGLAGAIAWPLTSSSPSIRNFTFTGNLPFTANRASMALMWLYICPLSSAEPRA